jgi:hypothetical protein
MDQGPWFKKVVEYMLTIIGLNFGYLVSFNNAALNCFSYRFVDQRIWLFKGGSVREDGSLFSIVEVAKVFIVKRKHGVCVHEEEFVENCTRRNLCIYVIKCFI